MKGEKLYVSWKDLEVIKVPQYKGIKTSNILKFVATKTNINCYLSEYDFEKESNREWVCNLVSSLIPDELLRFVQKKVKERRKEILFRVTLQLK